MYQGILKSWNDERGFGFIYSSSFNSNTFIHISALKHMSRKPVIGDVIHFDVETQSDGKQRAVHCRIEGVAKKAQRKRKTHRKKSSFMSKLVIIALLAGGVYLYQQYTKITAPHTPINSAPIFEPVPVEPTRTFESGPSRSSQKFSCNGKKHCSEMRSCAEATFYLNNCPGTIMDGDGDGKPCKRQHCGH
ncbi:hypothetical protein D5R81_03925 [Parashewanella spongiae]|uniref:CSD domain-containing protein n=1 Tax=Parashewanella spongiae TaxID=342950 RepID=A0A3A6TWH2_9GAMM|nr:excalibur calcium-binding domain-containing protein [Parashewanella spongiae]MCL1077040.1 excalibur calcium-binding domain-containing protein [Parashewanella spongiae]RJY18746.1 hypothetical protein D5R81_03925 [Parashewanella spongiae]